MAINFNFDPGREKREAREDQRLINRQVELQQRLMEQQAQATAGDRQGAAEALVMSDPTLRTAVGMNPNSPQSQGLLQGLASPDPAARGLAGQGAQNLMQAPEVMHQREQYQLAEEMQLRQMEMQSLYGGLSPEAWTKQYGRIFDMNIGMQNIEDLRTLNTHYGRETLPGATRGAYNALRGQVLNSLRVMFEAGALQKGELDFFQSMLPDFGAWQTSTKFERDTALRILQENMALKAQGLVQITPNVGMPQVITRDVSDILGEPPPPPGTEAVTSSFPAKVREEVTKPLDAEQEQALKESQDFGIFPF